MARQARCIQCKALNGEWKNGRITVLHAFMHNTGRRYICEACSPTLGHDVGGYTRENDVFVGKDTKGGFTLSKEFEVPYSADRLFGREGVAYLKSNKFIQTDDCTVWYEFKSPIFNNKNSWSRISREIESRFGTDWTSDNTYGTHTNVGHPDFDVSIVRQWYESLFTRLYATVRSTDDEKLRALFGRSWRETDWAKPYVVPYGEEHRLMWNVEHSTHMECRLVKWTSYEQDRRATEYAIETTAAIVEFCVAIRKNRETLGGNGLVLANRKAADKASRKIDNIFRKHVGLDRVNKTNGYVSR